MTKMKPIKCHRCKEDFEYGEIHSNTLVNYGAVSKCSFYFCRRCTEWLLRECRHYESSKEQGGQRMKFPELEDTVQGMLSPDHLVRLEAEYQQLSIRAHKLGDMLMRWDLGMLDFPPTCPEELLREQYEVMVRYGQILYTRIQIERADRSSKECEEVNDGSE